MMSDVVKNISRSERYADFDQMEYTPELASSLDIYADEITYHDGFEKPLNIRCNNQEIKEILNTLYFEVLNLEFNFIWLRKKYVQVWRLLCLFGYRR